MNTSAKLSLRNQLITIFSVMFLASCSSLESLKFWDNDEIDLDEPRPLNTITNKFEAKRNWEIKFNGENSLGNFIPAFSGDNLFASDSSGNIKSISASSGKVNWDIESNFLSSGIAAGFGILIVSDLDGNVIAIDQKDGSELWSVNVKGEVLAPAAIDAKFIIVKTGSGDLMALDKITGEIKWSYRSKLPTLTIRGSSSPVIFENQIYATFDNGRLGVFQIDSGFPVWDGAISYVSGASELENIIDADSNPVIDSGLVFTTNYQGNLNIFDIAQKRPVWNSKSSSFQSPVVTSNMILVVQEDGSILSFSLADLSPSWVSKDYLRRQLSNGVIFKNLMLVGDLEGYIHAVNPLTGLTLGRRKVSRKPIISIVTFREFAYVVDQESNIFAINL